MRSSRQSNDAEVAGIAADRRAKWPITCAMPSEWIIRLGDGTPESHARAQAALDELWSYAPELFEADALDSAMAA